MSVTGDKKKTDQDNLNCLDRETITHIPVKGNFFSKG